MRSPGGRGARKEAASLHDGLMGVAEDLPRDMLARLLEVKLTAAGLAPAWDKAVQLARQLLDGDAPLIEDDEGGALLIVDEHVSVPLTADDLRELHRETDDLIENKLPTIVEHALLKGADGLLRTLKRRWPEQQTHEKVADAGFRARLELRWGKAFDRLRMLLTISREIGAEFERRRRRSRARKTRLRDEVLVRLHVRACQVTAEILALMEAGYADGAMARWRTLHEIGVVATLIAECGDPLAARYLAHDATETLRNLDAYRRTYADLGYHPPAPEVVGAVEAAAKAAVARFGPDFSGHYGWAAELIGKRKPTFEDLAERAGRSALRAHYREASHNVHAGIKGITYKLAALGGDPSIAGSSNAGLHEPGQNAAITLTQITFLLLAPARRVDEVVQLKVLADLQGEAVDVFVRTGRRLRREEEDRLRRDMASRRARSTQRA